MKLQGKQVKKNDALKNAMHQAGHALLALVKGMKFDAISLTVADDGVVNGAVDNLVLPKDSRKNVFDVLVAGLAGERRENARTGSVLRYRKSMVDGKYTGSYTIPDRVEDDLNAAATYATGLLLGHADGVFKTAHGFLNMDEKKYGFHFNCAIEEGLRNAHRIVKKYSEAHKALTDAMLQRSQLSYEECKALVPANMNEADEVLGYKSGRTRDNDRVRSRKIQEAFETLCESSDTKSMAKAEMNAAYQRLVIETGRLQKLEVKTEADAIALDELRAVYRIKQVEYEKMLQSYKDIINTAYHEASHAVVAHSLGHHFLEGGITIIPSRDYGDDEDDDDDDDGYLGCVWVWKRDCPVVENVAIHLAGGMATRRMVPLRSYEDSQQEVSGDMLNTVFHLLGDNLEPIPLLTRRAWREIDTPHTLSVINPTSSESDPWYFKALTEGADKARTIVSERWWLIEKLARKLLKERQINGHYLSQWFNAELNPKSAADLKAIEQTRISVEKVVKYEGRKVKTGGMKMFGIAHWAVYEKDVENVIVKNHGTQFRTKKIAEAEAEKVWAMLTDTREPLASATMEGVRMDIHGHSVNGDMLYIDGSCFLTDVATGERLSNGRCYLNYWQGKDKAPANFETMSLAGKAAIKLKQYELQGYRRQFNFLKAKTEGKNVSELFEYRHADGNSLGYFLKNTNAAAA